MHGITKYQTFPVACTIKRDLVAYSTKLKVSRSAQITYTIDQAIKIIDTSPKVFSWRCCDMPRLRDPRLRPNRYKYGHDPSNEAGPSGLQDCDLNEAGPSDLHDCDLNGGENYFPLLLYLYIVKSPSN